MNSDVDSRILELAASMRAAGKRLPTRLADLGDFPFASFEALRTAIARREILLQRFSAQYEGNVFALLASPGKRAESTAYMTLAFLTPLAAIALAVFSSAWWLLGILAAVVFFRRTKALYNSVVLGAATRSEVTFAFLYYTRQVCLTTPDFKTSLYYKPE